MRERYDPLARDTSARGYEPIRCDACVGAGVSVRTSMNEPRGTVVDDSCGECEGAGRVWAVKDRHELTSRLTDRQRDLIQRPVSP